MKKVVGFVKKENSLIRRLGFDYVELVVEGSFEFRPILSVQTGLEEIELQRRSGVPIGWWKKWRLQRQLEAMHLPKTVSELLRNLLHERVPQTIDIGKWSLKMYERNNPRHAHPCGEIYFGEEEFSSKEVPIRSVITIEQGIINCLFCLNNGMMNIDQALILVHKMYSNGIVIDRFEWGNPA